MINVTYEVDRTSHGGGNSTGSTASRAMGGAARRCDLVSCTIHGENRILDGTMRLTDDGMSLAQDGDPTECGSVLVAKSLCATVR
ncbi:MULTISPECIES: PAAR domain-containing protein [unclassified Cupriavidus]|uniref:PAAR domain-containing protein n=1 Tax=unclassified Cupriavidus TaxID=2640874 RepID=UPI001BFFF512|nr:MULTISPECIES: PAAR domain-containing protein [unclassified Cupriavidus]MCA3185144.1 PAAR domain-containing protein [Cupriavidus sp.]MCA3192420.1 PAAR domain-containing protein [Cupriavidus sp.]MCA3198968.1 PAAR domain-containing protein [Cupriavidus sp.]MCA3205330.1 PAAR domain-containing protein [Cupriavidus sp.]MCA3207236.1 PAAR domain-containing protein [Cupriavidus sp.]